MTGAVHFDLPDATDHRSSSRAALRPALLRPVSVEEADNSVNEIHESLPRRAAIRLYRQISSGFNSRTIRCILIVSLCLNLIFAILIGIFVGFWQSRELDFTASLYRTNVPDSNQLTCLPCTDKGISGAGKGIPGLTVSVRSKNGVCCTQDTVPGYEQAERLLKLTSEYICNPVAESVAKGTKCAPGSSEPETNRRIQSAAHLTLNVTKSKENLSSLPGSEHYLAWITKDETGSSFLSEDLQYVNGTITIPTAGRYHVYTHLTFDTNSNRLQNTQLVVDHSIIRVSRGHPEQLVLDKVNLHSREIKSSDLEGTFELKQGDIVKVVVSFPSFLYHLPQTNVFGLFKLVAG